MQALTIDYRHDNNGRPAFIKHVEVEEIATQFRHQLVGSDTKAISLDTLQTIESLKINGVDFALEISTDCEVHDEQGNTVFGICEYDPGIPDTAMVCISPIGEALSELLATSTLAHELGHAVFDAPGWIIDGSKGPGLFDAVEPRGKHAYRTITPDRTHLGATSHSGERARIAEAVYFAELRANEFMGSLLVPRQQLYAAVAELAPKYGVKPYRCPFLDPNIPNSNLRIIRTSKLMMESFERGLATQFGVNPRFIHVRLQRYGLLDSGSAKR